MSGWNYVLRILKGESPASVIASMPEGDYEKVASAVDSMKGSGLSRQQRRKVERKLKCVRK